jgi:hypothetical protein
MPHKYWIRERGTDCYCPIEDGKILTGMNLVTISPPGICVGEFWYDKDFKIQAELKPKFGISASEEKNGHQRGGK